MCFRVFLMPRLLINGFLPSFTVVYWVLLGFIGFLLGFTWFYWVFKAVPVKLVHHGNQIEWLLLVARFDLIRFASFFLIGSFDSPFIDSLLFCFLGFFVHHSLKQAL